MPSGPKKRKAAKKKQAQEEHEQLEKQDEQHVKEVFANEASDQDHNNLPVSPNLQGNGHKQEDEAGLSEEQEFKKLHDSNSMESTTDEVAVEQEQEREEEAMETKAEEVEVSVVPVERAMEVTEEVAQGACVESGAVVDAVASPEEEAKSEPAVVETEVPALQDEPAAAQAEAVAVSSQEMDDVKAEEEAVEAVEASPAPTTEVVSRGVVTARQRAAWWDCCGLSEILGSSNR